MKDKVLFENNEFFLLRDYPKERWMILMEPDAPNVESEAFKACIAAKTRIDNPELLNPKSVLDPTPVTDWPLKDGDIFDLPDNVEFEEKSDQRNCNYCRIDCLQNLKGIPCKAPKIIHLKLEKVKEESQDELLIRGDVAAYNHAISDAKLLLYKNGRQVEGRMLDQLIKIEIQRIHPEQ